MLGPCLLKPACKSYIWGGTRLMTEFGKTTDGPRLAETWELSCHPDGPSIVRGGEYAGRPLAEALAEHPEALGSRARAYADFPVLIKLIDAASDLSVQVHPDDAYARRVENGFGKTEMWVVVDCEPGARLLYGFEREISREEFRRRIETDTLLEVARAVPVKPGDVFFIEAGTLHAIGKGILIAEIQQNSNLTYRIYDYGRRGDDGKPRELHVDKAVEVTALTLPARPLGPSGTPRPVAGGVRTELADCPFFKVSRYDADGTLALEAGEESFVSLLCLEGTLALEFADGRLSAGKGDSVFIPAGTGAYTCAGRGVFLETTV